MPYLKALPKINLGQGLAIYNPMIHPARLISRAFHNALHHGALQRHTEDMFVLERLQDLKRERQVGTHNLAFIELALGHTDRALDLLESRKITSLLVTDDSGRIEGVLHLHDLWGVGLF